MDVPFELILLLLSALAALFGGRRVVQQSRRKLREAPAQGLDLAKTPAERVRILTSLATNDSASVLLEAISRNLTTLSAHPMTASQTAEYLARLDEEQATDLLARLQREMSWNDRLTLIDLLEQRDDEIGLERILQVVQTACDEPLPNVARAGIEAIRRLHQSGASSDIETVLLACLRSRFRDLSLTALEAFAEIGSLGLTAEIREAAKSNSLGQQAEHALERIRQRHGAAPGGSLSVASPSPGGELSVSEETGALSLAQEELD